MRMKQRCWSIFAAKASFPLIPWKYSGVEYFQYSHVNAGIFFSPSCESVTEKYFFPLSCDWKIVGTRKPQDPPFSAHTGFLTKYRVHRCNYCFVSPFLRHETWIFSFFTHLTDSDTFFGRKPCGRKWSSLHRCPVLPFYVSSTPINRWFTHFIGIIMVSE